MGGLEKNDDDKDCRAIKKEFLEKFMPKESGKEEECNYNYNAFVELVNNHKKDLALCFRGNNAPYEAVCIYYRNHLVYKIQNNDRITISFNHARYSANYKDYWKWITRKYGFTPTGKHREEEVPSISLEENKSGYRANIGYITGCFKERAASIEHVENIYKDCLHPMIDKWFEEKETTDYFGITAIEDPKNENIKSHILTGPTRTKTPPLEKIRQQQLFCAMKDTQDGYFFFDMEFAQKSSKDTEDKGKNQPDMLAIRFKSGKPVAYVLVEVKSTKGAWSGKSGIREHLEKMEDYLKNEKLMKARRIEAARIIKCYKELGLYPSLGDIDEKDYEKIDKFEILLIVTDDAVLVCESILGEDKKIPHEDWGDIQPDDIGFKMEMYRK